LAGKHNAHSQSQHKYAAFQTLSTWEKQQGDLQFLSETCPQTASKQALQVNQPKKYQAEQHTRQKSLTTTTQLLILIPNQIHG